MIALLGMVMPSGKIYQMNVMEEYGFVVANDTLPTFHSDQQSNGNAPDITYFHSEHNLLISNWEHQNPNGKCHNDDLSYQIDSRDCINLLQPRHQKNTTVAWSKG